MSIGTESTAATGTDTGTGGGSGTRAIPPAHHAHAVMHCNLNAVDGPRAVTFHLALFGTEPRMHSVSTDGDSTSMGLSASTASLTTFLYDVRGPRSAPALEIVAWSRPPTEPVTRDHKPWGFTTVGYRVPSFDVISQRFAATATRVAEVPGGLWVRGAVRPALRLTDPDGVTVEVVQIPPGPDDPRRAALLSHERMRCTDLERTVAWYAGIGWVVRARGEGETGPTASLVLPEDPTFSLEFEQRPIPPGRNLPWAANSQGLYRIALAVEDVRAAHASLVADGTFGNVPETATMRMPDVPTGGFTVMFLTDPDGAVVELVDRPRSQVRRPLEPR